MARRLCSAHPLFSSTVRASSTLKYPAALLLLPRAIPAWAPPLYRPRRTFTAFSRTRKEQLQSESEQKRQSWYDAEEPLDRYCDGGYHPVSIGDRFKDNRYGVLRKLGWGRYSTIWLAKDHEKDTYVSLKLLTSEWTPRQSLLSEPSFLHRAASANPSHPGYPHVLKLLDEFRLKGPNGEHIVMVTEVLGEDLVRVRRRYENGRLPVGVVKQVAKQVLLGLEYLHKECGLTHTDMKPDNILIALPSPAPGTSDPHAPTCVSNKFIAQCLTVLKPQSETVTVPSGEVVPISVSQALPIFAMRKETNGGAPLEINVKIVDLGVANWNEDHWADAIQSPALRAPEVILGAGWDTGADIWATGCMIYELITGEWLFNPAKGDNYTLEQDHLSQMVELLEPIPPSLIAKGTNSSKLLAASGALPPIDRPPLPTLERLLEANGALSEEEFVSFVSFIRPMLHIDPAKRATATELLQHQWVRDGRDVHWWSGV